MNHLKRYKMQLCLEILVMLCAYLYCPAQQIPSVAGLVSWYVPQDGGTPRDPKQVQQVGPNEFFIRAVPEEGGVRVLMHAVSRMDLICRNSSAKPVTITVRIDLSDDGKRTDYDNKPEAGMKLRDFLFIQKPAGIWQQINGHTEKWISIVRFTVPPGNTKVGLSPWYTYSDYISFIKSIPEGRYIKKQMIGKSDGGRAHWELTITDTAVKASEKKKIFWQAREHAYETYSSFAMEGLIPFLLSDEAAAFRKQYVITIHPMTNIDGVAEGFEYRAGYDFPDPRKTATGRLTFEMADRLHADYAVAWHNWIAPRDRNVVFYTDGDKGTPTPRAWLRFTQLFPSLRSSGHRWKDEENPLKYNWEDKVLGLYNIHQYTMKQYGTRIWGWEMPWWNCSVAEVRRSGAAFGRAFLNTITELQEGRVPESVERKTVEVLAGKAVELRVAGALSAKVPLKMAAVVGEFRSPSGKLVTVDGVHAGKNEWKIFFTPSEEGDWSYRLRGEGVGILEHGKLKCVLR